MTLPTCNQSYFDKGYEISMSESQISILQDRQGCLVLVSKSSNNVRVVIENLLQRILKIIIIRINVNKKYSYVKQKSNIRTDQIHTTIGSMHRYTTIF